MARLWFGHERPTDSDCCLICTCTCLSVRNFENAINNSYTHIQPHCIFCFFQCRTGVVADCFKFCGTRHARQQRRAARFVINDYTSRTQGCVTSMLTSLEWQTLEQRRRISRLVMMYKIQHQLVDIDQDSYLRPGDSRTRGQHRFFQEGFNYDTLRNSFQRTAREWNHLPDTTQMPLKSGM
jgi:hypothetical protein